MMIPTHKLADIIKFNSGLQKKIESDSKREIIDDWLDLVQYHVATLIDNELSEGSIKQPREVGDH